MNQKEESWVSKYINFMLADNPEKAYALKMQNFSKSFYKYKQLNNDSINALENDYLWLANFDSLNDPYECSILFDNHEFSRHSFLQTDFPSKFKSLFNIEISKEEIDVIIKSEEPYRTYTKICNHKGIVLHVSPEEQLHKAQEMWKEITERGRSNVRICSFSERNDSLLMWSHYANEHKGICLEYDFEFDENVRTFLQPVLYTNKLYKQKTINEPFAINQIMASLTKAKDWQYEKEWRLTVFTPLGKEINPRHKASRPKAIYLGARFHLNADSDQKKIYELSGTLNIPIIKMSIHPTEYKIIKALNYSHFI